MKPVIPDENDPTEVMVAEFINVFDASRDPEMWKNLVREERKEVEQAVAHLLKELADLAYVINGAALVGVSMDDLIRDVGEPADVVIDLYQSFDADLMQEAFKRVHASNMSKLVDGKPLRREDGKILKGPNYAPPVLDDLVAPPTTTH